MLTGATIMGFPVDHARPPASLYTSGWQPMLLGPRRPILLDLFCGRGGAGVGYYAAGFDVVGVDLRPQPLYPFHFVQADALDFIAQFGHLFDAAHASPPCQGYSRTAALATGWYPKLIPQVREALLDAGIPYVIENVEGARYDMKDPVLLCMAAWARRMYRHRLFESNVPLMAPWHPEHNRPQAKMGRPAGEREMHVAVGNFPQIREVRRQMEMPWADRDGIAEGIPPVFTDYLGRRVYAHLIDVENGVIAA